jgi:hypothetical protein
MRAAMFMLALSVPLLGAINGSANADEGPAVRHARRSAPTCQGPKCGPYAPCGVRCRVICPDGYSCQSLYGAYGPYGGTAYWGAYTYSGWGRY